MRIKVFIVSYKSENFLKENVDSLLSSDLVKHDHEINVINNYTGSFEIEEYLIQKRIKILHNNLRPDFSTGHLSRNWNQAIINGIKDLKNPDCDILVLCQNDTFFQNDWCEQTINLHEKYEFITMGGGDQFHSYLPEHIKKVGLWDERFCNIGYQEADYFIRSYLYNKDKATINDPLHGRIHNPVNNRIIATGDHYNGGCRREESHLASLAYHPISKKVLHQKWGEFEENWSEHKLGRLPRESLIDNYVYYPYFEKDVIDLRSKRYVV